MNKRTKRSGTSTSDLRVHVLVLLTLLAALVVTAGLVSPEPTEPAAIPAAIPQEPEAEATEGRPQAPVIDSPVDPGGKDVLYVPAIDLLAPMVDIEMDEDGVLSPPADPDIVGWWQRSAEPGARRGQTVITGHTVHSGDGVMDELGELGPGDVVRVRDENKVTEYRVTDNQTLSAEEVAENAQMLFGQEHEDGRLVLVTCTDWVDGNYLSNIIVVADVVRG
jgi:LPXTG-site transpeptidase (sortase) family protein